MQRIVFYIDVLVVGGIEKVLIELLKNLDKKKFDITLLIGYNLGELEKLKGDIPNWVKIRYIFNEGFYTVLKKKKVAGNMKKYEKILFESYSWLRKLVMKKRILNILRSKDILVDYDMTLSPFIRDFPIKKITFCHFSPKNYNRGIVRRQRKLGNRLKFYNKIFVISDEMKKEALDIYPFLNGKIVRLYNSFNIKKIEERAKDPIQVNENYILAIGRLEETQKDFTNLIKAYAKISDRIEEKLYIIGDGRHRQYLENLVKDLKLADRVLFLGFVSNPYPYIKTASLFVHSSKFEGLPTVLIEALILNKVMVATDCPTGPREILNNGKNGILVQVGDTAGLAKAMTDILLKKVDIVEYENNMKEWSKEFDSEMVVRKFEEYLLKN